MRNEKTIQACKQHEKNYYLTMSCTNIKSIVFELCAYQHVEIFTQYPTQSGRDREAI
jgi:hypothetical protein